MGIELAIKINTNQQQQQTNIINFNMILAANCPSMLMGAKLNKFVIHLSILPAEFYKFLLALMMINLQ